MENIVTLSDLIKEYNELRSGLQLILEEANRYQLKKEKKSSPDDRYYECIQEFQEDAVKQFDELEVRYTSMDIAYKDVVTFFGENASEMKPDEFFGIFKTFTSSWEVCVYQRFDTCLLCIHLLNGSNFHEQKAMSDNVNAKKKLEQIEKARQVEKERKEKISERKKTKGIDISEGEKIVPQVNINPRMLIMFTTHSWRYRQGR
jgi:cytokinesis protein